jgi:hypothetical protein
MISWILRHTIYRHCSNIDWEKYGHLKYGFVYNMDNYYFFQRSQSPYRQTYASNEIIIMRRWLRQNLKPYDWMILVKCKEDIQHDNSMPINDFYFRKKSYAIMFKLRWG